VDASSVDRTAVRKQDPSGYTLVLPPGWRQIPVRAGTRRVIKEIVDDAFRVLPKHISRDRLAPYRVTLQQRLVTAAAQARSTGGTELYLPVEPVHGMLLPASFVAAEGAIGSSGQHDLALILSSMSEADGGSATVTLDGAPAVRTERAAAPEPDSGAECGSRRVDYAVSVPGAPGRWLIFAFSALKAGDARAEFAGIMVELFDAIMSTFRWTGATDKETSA
jgi:hypothetical protein